MNKVSQRTTATAVATHRTRRLGHLLAGKPLGAAGAAFIVLMILMAIFAPFVSPHDPIELHFDDVLAKPGWQYWLGTDTRGQDIASQLIWGARVSIYVGIVSVAVGTGIGAAWGLVSAYVGGKFDLISQRLVDLMMGFPSLILAMALVAALGAGLNNVVLAISFVFVPRSTRVVRASALVAKEMDFVLAARAIGVPGWRMVLVHLLPQCIAPYIIVASTSLGLAILVEASLSFLGLGVPPPNPSWGRMLAGIGREFMTSYPQLTIFPGLAITLTVLSFNLFGDAIRDIMDPRLRVG